MADMNETLRHEVFISETADGPSRSLSLLKAAAETYVNEHDLTDNVISITESIYEWGRVHQPGVSQATVTVWFQRTLREENPPRRDSYQ